MYFAGMAEINGMILEYYVCGSYEINEHTKFFEWGIRVEKKAPVYEWAEIRNISPDFQKTFKLAEALRKNTVTPTGLKDALENMLQSRQAASEAI